MESMGIELKLQLCSQVRKEEIKVRSRDFLLTTIKEMLKM